MKTIIFLLTFSFSFSVSSFAVVVDVISAEIGVEDETGRPELCLTIVRSPEAKIVGIVESKFDCFYTRKAKRNNQIEIHPRYLGKVERSLLSHLQSRDPSVEFVYSDGE